jgi:tryptophan synthase beta subunit
MSVAVTDKECLEAFHEVYLHLTNTLLIPIPIPIPIPSLYLTYTLQCSRTEGIIPALEPSHALWQTMEVARQLGKGKVRLLMIVPAALSTLAFPI